MINTKEVEEVQWIPGKNKWQMDQPRRWKGGFVEELCGKLFCVAGVEEEGRDY